MLFLSLPSDCHSGLAGRSSAAFLQICSNWPRARGHLLDTGLSSSPTCSWLRFWAQAGLVAAASAESCSDCFGLLLKGWGALSFTQNPEGLGPGVTGSALIPWLLVFSPVFKWFLAVTTVYFLHLIITVFSTSFFLLLTEIHWQWDPSEALKARKDATRTADLYLGLIRVLLNDDRHVVLKMWH